MTENNFTSAEPGTLWYYDKERSKAVELANGLGSIALFGNDIHPLGFRSVTSTVPHGNIIVKLEKSITDLNGSRYIEILTMDRLGLVKVWWMAIEDGEYLMPYEYKKLGE